jgi:hypothetical protein
MNLEAVIERGWRCIWRPGSRHSEIHVEAMIERVWIYLEAGIEWVHR